MNKNRNFTKICNNLCYLFDYQEIGFLMHLTQINFIRECGYNTSYSRDFMLKKFRMNVRVFQRCTNRFIEMGLLEKKRKGLHFDYLLNKKRYERLLDIVCATNDVFALTKFCKKEFIKGSRTIDSITDSEIQILREQGESNKHKCV